MLGAFFCKDFNVVSCRMPINFPKFFEFYCLCKSLPFKKCLTYIFTLCLTHVDKIYALNSPVSENHPVNFKIDFALYLVKV